MKKVILLAVISFPMFLLAQKQLEDVMYLKSGSIIRGIIKEQNAQLIKVELTGGSVFVFQQQEIDSVRKENSWKRRLKEIRHNYFRKDRGFRNMTEAGAIYGMNLKKDDPQPYYYSNSDDDDIGMSLHTVNGYQFWHYLYVGAGMGIDRFITLKQTFSPFYLRVVSEPLKTKVSPYVFLDAGYALMWQKKSDDYVSYSNKGGLYISAGGGLRIYTRSRASVILSAAYKRTTCETKWWYTSYNETYYTIQRTYQRLSLNLGVTF